MIQKMTQAQISRLFNQTYDREFNESELEALGELQPFYENLMKRILMEYRETGSINDSFFDALSLEESLIVIYLATGNRFKNWWENLFSSISDNPTPPSDLINEVQMRQVARQRVSNLSTQMRQTARRRASAIIDKIRQENPDASLQRVADIVLGSDELKNSVDAMTMRTVRTEVNAAANESINHTALQMNNRRNLFKRWETFGDERVRPTHRAVGSKKPIPFNELFQVGNTYMRFPSDPEAFGGNVAGNVVNCRCRMVVIPRSRVSRFFTGIRDFFGL